MTRIDEIDKSYCSVKFIVINNLISVSKMLTVAET